jgi:hypothetical protein
VVTSWYDMIDRLFQLRQIAVVLPRHLTAEDRVAGLHLQSGDPPVQVLGLGAYPGVTDFAGHYILSLIALAISRRA